MVFLWAKETDVVCHCLEFGAIVLYLVQECITARFLLSLFLFILQLRFWINGGF